MRLDLQANRRVLFAFLQGAASVEPGRPSPGQGDTLYFGLVPVARRFVAGQAGASEKLYWFDTDHLLIVRLIKEAAMFLQGRGVSIVSAYLPPADLAEALAWRDLHLQAIEATLALRRQGWRPLIALPDYAPTQPLRRWRHGVLTGRMPDPDAPALCPAELPLRAGLLEHHRTRYRPGTATRPRPQLGKELWASAEGAGLVSAGMALAKAQQLPVRTAIHLLLAGRAWAVS